MTAFECFVCAGLFNIGVATVKNKVDDSALLLDTVVAWGFFLAGIAKTVWP